MKKTIIVLLIFLIHVSTSSGKEVAWYHFVDIDKSLTIKKTVKTPQGLVVIADLDIKGKTIRVKSRPVKLPAGYTISLKEAPNVAWHDHSGECVFDFDEAKDLLDVQTGTEVGYFLKDQLVWDRVDGFRLTPDELYGGYTPEPIFPKKPGLFSTPFYFLKKGFEGKEFSPKPFIFTENSEKQKKKILDEFARRHVGRDFDWAKSPEKCNNLKISSDGLWLMFSQDLNGSGVYVVHGQTYRYFQDRQVYEVAKSFFHLGSKVYFCDYRRIGEEGGGYWYMAEWGDKKDPGASK